MVGGAFLSASLQVLFDRMASRELVEFIRGKVDKEQLWKLKMKLSSAKAVLNDAEEKQIRCPDVKEWLDELKEAIYDAEDLMDQINTEVLRQKLDTRLASTSSSQVRNFFITSFSAFSKRVDKEIVDILERLNIILEQKKALGLKEGLQHGPPPGRLPATSLVEACGVCGRNKDKEAVIKSILLDDDGGPIHNLSVIPIVGMAGIGKTTLAQLVFNDPSVKDRFAIKLWVSVSYEFDVFKMTREILLAVTDQIYTSQDLNLHQVKLEEALNDKRFLLVLDDVWNGNDLVWDEFKKPFKSGARGSAILVTTQSEGVASVMRSVPSYRLETMTDEDSWELFAKHAFNNKNVANPCVRPTLEGIGRQIVKRCRGLPLAVKSLGTLLSYYSKPEEWETVLNSDMWELPSEKNNILPALWLSYHYLPSHLKRCFAYCSIFPKEYKMNKEDLIKLWMAEDLLQPQNKKRIEEVGEEYVDNLLSRSLFQQSISVDNSSTNFTMHELMNDLATFITREFCWRLDDHESNKLPSKLRHLSHVKAYTYDSKRYKDLLGVMRLRTFLSSQHYCNVQLQNLVVSKWLPTLTCLRVLSLCRYSITELPASIGDLKLLRYLDLSNTKIKHMPATICTLYNLRTLLLRDCEDLTLLPADIRRLINLRHLDITSTDLQEMPSEMGNLKDLQILTHFILGKDSGCTIRELHDLHSLHGSLYISGLENVVDVDDALVANLKDKKHLTELQFTWDTNFDDCQSQEHREVLNGLQPHTNIKVLSIIYYGGEEFPKWVGDESFWNMEQIHLRGCKRCSSLPPLGQLPHLKQVEIMGFDAVVKIGDEFYYSGTSSSTSTQPFRCLESIRFDFMREWQEWSFPGEDIGFAFPQLKKLDLVDCPKLTGRVCLPDTIESVHISECSKFESYES